jgi:gamma-glutamyltranspeptidase/glutathione hydrolase
MSPLPKEGESMPTSWREPAGLPFNTIKHEAVGSRAVVTSNHPLASAAGLETLARGGNAVDAAIATAAALTVVEPMMVGIFGGGMILLRDGVSGEITTIDNYPVAPAAARPDLFIPVDGPDSLEVVGRENEVGYRSVGVPGALPAWAELISRRGRLSFAEVLAPAIRYAAEGFVVSPYLASCVATAAADLARFPASAEIFLPGGEPPRPGQRLVCSDYARTLAILAQDGPAALAEGAIGATVAADMAHNGGLITQEDLAAYRFVHRAPVRGTYRGYEIVSVGPTSSGGTHIIQVLNILEGFDLLRSGFGNVATVHLIAEALKIAFADRALYMGDPAFVDVPVQWLTDKEYARQRRAQIDPTRAGCYEAGRRPPAERDSANTTHLTVMDAEGNVVAMTQTLQMLFGSKVTVPGTGILLNNHMSLFDPHPGRPNSIAARKRMLSSMSPTIVLKDGKPRFALGTPGGLRIFPAVLQAIVNVLDHGMTLQEAVEAPRVWARGSALEIEEAFPEQIRATLAALGHEIAVVPRVAGGMNGVMCDPDTGLLHGAACWRADGTPVALSGGFTDRIAVPGVPTSTNR